MVVVDGLEKDEVVHGDGAPISVIVRTLIVYRVFVSQFVRQVGRVKRPLNSPECSDQALLHVPF